jgi:hypothetical protein
MARTFRRKTGRKTRSNKKLTRRNRRKIMGGVNISKTLAAALGLLAGVNGMFPDANDATLTLLNGEKTIVKTGWGGVYIDKKYIEQPVVERPQDERGVSIIPNEKGLSTISSGQEGIFKPVKLAGQETKWTWVNDKDLCERLGAISLEPKYRPNENVLKCKITSNNLALPKPDEDA